jgi:hypothetical protein
MGIGQRGSQRLAGTVATRFHRSFRDTQQHGRLCVGQTIQDGRFERGSQLW